VELREYARHDDGGLRDLMAASHVTAAETEAVARRAIDALNAEVNGLALPLFSPALGHAADGPLAGVPFLIKDSGPLAAARRSSWAAGAWGTASSRGRTPT
jgi:amidase